MQTAERTVGDLLCPPLKARREKRRRLLLVASGVEQSA
jgi:hypothetical protein